MFRIAAISLFSILFAIYSCNVNHIEKNNSGYKKNILGTWKEINSESPGFKMTRSSMIMLDSSLISLLGEKLKYNIKKDSLFVSIGDIPSNSKILLLTNDSLITLDKSGIALPAQLAAFDQRPLAPPIQATLASWVMVAVRVPPLKV